MHLSALYLLAGSNQAKDEASVMKSTGYNIYYCATSTKFSTIIHQVWIEGAKNLHSSPIDRIFTSCETIYETSQEAQHKR